MKYTIDVDNILTTTHRLKKEGIFKKYTGDHEKDILEDDLTFDDYYDARNFKEKLEFVEIDGEKIKANPTSYGLSDPVLYIRPHRTGKPVQSYFTEDDLKRELLSGNDEINNSLIVDTDGFLHLVPFNQAKKGPYAVRFETFIAGNGYVGSESSLNHLEGTYLALLEAWSIHLVSHDKVYRDYYGGKSKEELINKIIKTIEGL